MTTLLLVRRRALLACALVMLAGCSREQLLEVSTPDQIRPDDAASPAGALALRAAAIGNFSNFYSGTANVGVNLYVGLLSDELINARPGADHIDQRQFNENVFPNTTWNNFSNAHSQIIRAVTALNKYSPAGATRSSQISDLYARQAVGLSIAGELFCNGVPLANGDDVNPVFTTMSNAQLFTRALTQADSALTVSSAADVNTRYLARIAKARALINLGRFPDAAAAVAAGGDGAGSIAVPTSFVFNTEYSATTLVNTIFDWMVNTANFGPSDREGGNGLPFRTARDPRVVIGTTSRLGQDGSTQVFTVQGYPNGASPTNLATGVEARLIEAEAAQRAGSVTASLAALNAARADAGVRTARGIVTPAVGPDPLPPLTDPGTDETRVTQIFTERAFWMYLTAHRVGDLRRQVRQYTRAATSVWPSGAYFKGGTYGADQNITPSFAERNNPTYTGCTDRSP